MFEKNPYIIKALRINRLIAAVNGNFQLQPRLPMEHN